MSTKRTPICAMSLLLVGCSTSAAVFEKPNHDAPMASTDAGDGASDPDAAPTGDAGSAAPAICNGYEPCGVSPVTLPTGYTLQMSLAYDDYVTTGSCTTFEDCGMWNTHYTMPYDDANGNPYSPYANRFGQPFPYQGGRYIFDLRPNKVSSIKFHLVPPGQLLKYGDGTNVTTTDRETNVTSCYQRTTATMKQGLLQTMGGTGELGFTKWTISKLPGDMGDSGNVSSCQGTGSAVDELLLTSDPTIAAGSLNANTGAYGYCLLRDNTDYYLNFMSYGAPNKSVDCSKDSCSYGGFVMQQYVGSDNSTTPNVAVPCP